MSGPGERYALRPTTEAPAQPVVIPAELPEAYGTERLFLTARDPRWLYAAWDLTAEQRRQYNSRSRDGHLVVRTFVHEIRAEPCSETHLHPESKSWFIPVDRGGTRYRAELGYYDRAANWHGIATSPSTLTPPDTMSQEATAEFATIPPEVTLRKLFTVVQQAVTENVPLVEAVQQLRADGWTELPPEIPTAPAEWTPAQARALAEVVRLDEARRVWMGSIEITELIRRHLQQDVSSGALAAGAPQPAVVAAAAGPGMPLAGISSLFAAGEEEFPPGARPFWFNLNAELILYGATETDATVTIGNRQIRLRPDGTFSYRFALPDGQYGLSVRAQSAEGDQTRAAELHFSRSTQYQGDVAAHPQDPQLRPPAATALA